MLKNSLNKDFYGVAMAIILAGSTAFALGIVEWLMNYYSDTVFVYPTGKILSGLIILALGYLLLEAELIRTKK